jgi:RNA polymerase sigma-70 factor (ECF subfamily)
MDYQVRRMPHEVTELLNQWSSGDQAALEQLMSLVYAELHKLARGHMRRQNPDHTLQTTALIHEAWLRMAGDSEKNWKSRAHFYGVAAKAMRHVLVDYARKRHAAKRGAGVRRVPLEEGISTSDERLTGLIALDEALTRLGGLHSRQSQVVELRFFGGFSVEDTADLLKVSAETVMLDWRAAKAWLHKELSRNDT